LPFHADHLEDKYSLTSEKKIQKALSIIADSNKYHPIRDYLNGLEWDGTERIRYALPRFLGAEEGEYTYQALRLFMLGAISRVFKPGCKFEVMLCLVGGQGAGKSTFFRLLAVKDEWFSDDLKKIDDDNVYRKMQGHWIIEMSEMIATANAKSIEDIKSFISRAKETYKVPYETHPADRLRQCVFGGSSNTMDFLPLDRSGNRRFLPIMVHPENAEMRYNPFHYIRSEKDILKLVNTIIANTKGDGEKSGEDFWVKAERLLYCALIGYIWYEAPEEEQNFSTLLEFINASEAREDDEEFKNPVDELFEELEQKKPEHFAVRQYKKYKLAAGKTAKSILISCGARLAPFDIVELRDLMAYDEMELDLLGDRRTALFVIISDTDDTFNFVVSIMYTQLFNLLCDRADDQCGGQLKYHVRLLLDEFANIGLIPKFDKLIATIRSREISASIILQSQSQLKTIYKDAAETIIGNCDTMLFLGGKESSTLKEISETLGKETIDLYNTSDTRGQSPSFGTTYQKTGKELMSRDELSVMDGSKCILQLRGVRPFLSDKFDITKHKRYKELSDFDKKNAFDVERYLKHELRLRMDEEFDCYEVDVSEESTA
jgi:plasmid maintenance system killer protein